MHCTTGKKLKKNKNQLALVKNAELNKITIPPNTVMEIQGNPIS
jgi:hypothetical protein